MRLGVLASVIVAALIAQCAVSPTPEPAVVGQRHVCGNLSADVCEGAIAAVILRVPEMADSPIAVTATLDPDRPSQRGGDTAILVGFAPIGGQTEMWSPGIWLTTQGMLSSVWLVEVWREGPLPDHFIALMRANGLEG